MNAQHYTLRELQELERQAKRGKKAAAKKLLRTKNEAGELPADILRKADAKQRREALEDAFAFAWQIETDGNPELKPIRQYEFHPERKWLFDFAWKQAKLAVEIHGGTWINGAHNRGGGMANDCDKKREAIALGWRVLEFTDTDLKNPFECVRLALRVVNKAW